MTLHLLRYEICFVIEVFSNGNLSILIIFPTYNILNASVLPCYVWQAVIEAVGKSGLRVTMGGKKVSEPNEDEKELSTVVLKVSLPSGEEEKVGVSRSTLRLFVFVYHTLITSQPQPHRIFGLSVDQWV